MLAQVSNRKEYTLIKPHHEVIDYYDEIIGRYENNSWEDSHSLIWMYNDSIMIENSKQGEDFILYPADERDTTIAGTNIYYYNYKPGKLISVSFYTDEEKDLIRIFLYAEKEFKYYFSIYRSSFTF